MPSLIGFSGDLILFGCLLGVIRFLLVSAALDTGSSFEGMGASREVQFSALAEPALLLALAVFAHKTLYVSLRDMFAAMGFFDWYQSPSSLFMALAALIIVMLAENARIPVDDPNTHLELTMIHEVMVLDYTGPDLAFVLYTAALKLWLFGAVIIGLFLPIHSDHAWLNVAVGLMGMFGIAVLVGTVESVMARLRLLNVPQLLVGASALAVVALALMLR
jgi:formate hydrogenlyase subunit 4